MAGPKSRCKDNYFISFCLLFYGLCCKKYVRYKKKAYFCIFNFTRNICCGACRQRVSESVTNMFITII